MNIVVHIFMFIFPNMVFCKVCKNSIIKFKSTCSMKHQCLRRYFHNNIFQSCVRHLTERFLYDIRFWCCIDGWNSLISDDCLNRSDQSCLLSCMFEDYTDHIRCCCLSFGSCDTDRCQLFCWISKVCC